MTLVRQRSPMVLIHQMPFHFRLKGARQFLLKWTLNSEVPSYPFSTNKSFTLTFRKFAISKRDSKEGWDSLVHHLETETLLFPSAFANSMAVTSCSARTALILLSFFFSNFYKFNQEDKYLT